MTLSPFKRRVTISTLYAIYFFDLMGMSIVLVIFPPLIVQKGHAIVSPDLSLAARNLLLGFLLASYSVAQFFGAPLLGELSDRFGRRRLILLSTLGTALAFGLTAISIAIDSLSLLFASRLLGGFSAGNMTIAQASVSDMTPKEKRGRYMAAFSMVGGLSWTLGPLIAAFLTNPKLVSWFSFPLPFWIIAGAFLAAFALTFWGLTESQTIEPGGKLALHRAFGNILSAVRDRAVFHPFLVSVINIIGWALYQTFLGAYLIERFDFTVDYVGYAFAASSISWFAGGLLANQWLLKRYRADLLNIAPLIVCTASVAAYFVIANPLPMWFIVVIANTSASLAMTCFFTLFAELAPPDRQGKVFGSWNAGFAVALAVGPLVSGIVARLGIQVPYALASAVLLASTIYYLLIVRKIHPDYGKSIT